MSIITKMHLWLNAHPATKQWAWFVMLWCLGLVATAALCFPFKLLIRLAG